MQVVKSIIEWKLVCITLLSIIIASCGNGPGENDSNSGTGEKYGGVFAYNQPQEIKTLFPPKVYFQAEVATMKHVFETLIKMGPDLTLEPWLAESWEISEDLKTYTFKIRQGIMFQESEIFPDRKGREMNAHDVKFCLDKVCEDFDGNSSSHYFKGVIEGSESYFNASSEGEKPNEGVSGISVLDDYTLQIKLENPYKDFIAVLSTIATAVYAPEGIDHFSNSLDNSMIGTGPFKISKFTDGVVVILEKNHHYWKKNAKGENLPFLDGVKISIDQDTNRELNAIEKGIIQLVPEFAGKSRMLEIMKSNPDFTIHTQSLMGTEFLAFLIPDSITNNKNLRRALQYGVDRQFIIDSIMGGVGKPAYSGIVPPVFEDYVSSDKLSLNLDPQKGILQLDVAGFKEDNMPELTLASSNDEDDIQIASAVKQMFRDHLNLNISTKFYSKDDFYKKIETGQTNFFMDYYFGDYPSPENFLHSLFYGKYVSEDFSESPGNNFYRYKNRFFDLCIDSARFAPSEEVRNKCFQRAEHQLISDAVVVPLFYHELQYAVDNRIQNFMMDPLKCFDLREVYFSSQL